MQRRKDLIFNPVKFNFQGLAYFTGIEINTPIETILIQPTNGGQIILKSTSKLRKTELFLKYSELMTYLNEQF